MKKSIIILTLCIVSLTTQAQEYEVKLIEIDSSAKYSLPPKPDSCEYLIYNDNILGYFTHSYNYKIGEFVKYDEKKIHLYNGNTFEIENLEEIVTNIDASVFFSYGNKTIPYADTSILTIYNNKGKLIYRTEEYGYGNMWINSISENGYFVALTQIRNKGRNIILYSPKGELIFAKPFNDIYNDLAISQNGEYVYITHN